METTTITTTQTAFTFGLTERRASITLHAPAQDCAVPAPHPDATAAGYQSKTKVLKRQRSNSPELLRCKRRLSFNGLGYSIPQQQPVAVARRNERERNRVKQVNMGFQTLRQHVPNGAANKKMSKVETLRSAVEYIRALQQLLDEHDAVSAAFQCGLPSPTLSNSYSADPESPHSSYSSDEGGYEPLSSEEQELLDFTTWFDRGVGGLHSLTSKTTAKTYSSSSSSSAYEPPGHYESQLMKTAATPSDFDGDEAAGRGN
ncbi:hypothetical protein F2P81_007214 [Scophthalmus maximus]|uniref:BHLH domain-containing protein n=1 Tax=Scophthalmus maximus TaxID=52904 RepID=A0A6A4T1K5_SCOMX|nr:hypothetical protein F2P81_007214 [Scophthalmus maximus]